MMSVGHVLDHMLDHMIIGLVTTALQRETSHVTVTYKDAICV